MRIVIWIPVTLVFILDQISKFIASHLLTPAESIAVIPGVFHLTLVRNTGAAFGIFKNQTVFFILASLAACGFIFFLLKKKTGIFTRDVGFALVLGGALGNLVDRLRFGYVTDFLDFRVWPVFNVADSAITLGAFLIIVSVICKKVNACIQYYSDSVPLP